MYTTQRTELKLFFDNEHKKVWFCDESGVAHCSTKEPWEFVSSELCDTESVRLLGLPTNASLIAFLYQSREQYGYPLRVQVGTPAVCGRRYLRDPAQAMFQMQEVDGLTGSKGGWREITKHDFASALIQCSFQEGEFENIDEILTDHPAWAAISFVPTVDTLEAARLLAEIGDPRWFVDPDKPERYARLRSYLGLTQRNLRYICGWDHNGDGPGFNHDRCQIVYNAWLGTENARHVTDDPRDFLRLKVRQYQVQEANDVTKGILKGMTKFVNFIRLVWLETASPHGGEIFAPDHFFASDSMNDSTYRMLLKMWKKHYISC